MSTENRIHTQQDVAVLEKIKEPPMYKLILFNDNVTPMEFVIYILVRIFGMSESESVDLMLKIHNEGIGVCGIFPFEIAETKIAEVRAMVRKEKYPLKSDMEKI